MQPMTRALTRPRKLGWSTLALRHRVDGIDASASPKMLMFHRREIIRLPKLIRTSTAEW